MNKVFRYGTDYDFDIRPAEDVKSSCVVKGQNATFTRCGWIFGVENNDINEKLAADILNTLNIPCAKVDLAYDQDIYENAYITYPVTGEGEKLVIPKSKGFVDNNKDNLQNCFDNYIAGVKELSNDEDLLKSCKKNFYEYMYMSCILDSYCHDTPNLPLIYDKGNDSYRVSPWSDFETAFHPQFLFGVFAKEGTNSIMNSLFKNHYEDIEDISTRVHKTLTPEKITELFNSDYVVETLSSDDILNRKARITEMIDYSKSIEHRMKNPSKLSIFMGKFKNMVRYLFTGEPMLPEASSPSYTANTQNNLGKELSELTNNTIEDNSTTTLENTPPVKDKPGDDTHEL